MGQSSDDMKRLQELQRNIEKVTPKTERSGSRVEGGSRVNSRDFFKAELDRLVGEQNALIDKTRGISARPNPPRIETETHVETTTEISPIERRRTPAAQARGGGTGEGGTGFVVYINDSGVISTLTIRKSAGPTPV